MFVFVLTSQLTIAQNISQAQLTAINIDELSDEQITTYWNKVKSEGYTLDQLEVIATSKGMPASEFMKLKQRIDALKYTDTTSSLDIDNLDGNEITNLDKFGLEGKMADETPKIPLYGYDFFSNPNISFTPNSNLATPSTYELGPGDEILIDIWGAAENNYKLQVNREGAIRIENIGPVYVSGLSVNNAKEKIISYLRKIYSGIGAASDSYDKVYADVSLIGVRTVQVNIIGEVKAPGTYSVSGLSSVLNALYAAGGPTEKGTFRSVQIIRGGKRLKDFDIYKYLIEGSEEGNVLLRDQDIIIVKPYVSIITVAGNVKRPGLYELKQGETISDLVRYFSGFTSDAYQDRILVERVNGSQKEVDEIVFREQPDFLLKDGDKLSIGAIIDRYENRVRIEGAVYRPGTYELTKDLTLSGLLNKAAGVKENAYLDRGIIYRSIDDIKQEIVSFSVSEILKNPVNINLKREDRVRIFSSDSLREKHTVTINGAINNPQTVVFMDNMHIEDLIAIAGGFKEGADASIIDISRRLEDDNFETISKTIKRSSTNNLLIDENKDFYLEPFDRVLVRYLKGYSIQKYITVLGEVSYPGNYSITNKGQRVSDLVEMAGGFSPYAFIEGAYLSRKVGEAIENSQITLLNELTVQDSLSNTEVLKKEIKIGLDLQKIMKAGGKGSKYDLILEEGDVLTIPSEKQTVTVRGEVLSPSLIRYDKSNSLEDYINFSGGYSLRAKKNKSYVIYANGDIKSTKSFLFFKASPKLAPGALIVVPNKGEKPKVSLTEVLAITTTLTTLVLLINSIK
ncbi:MAG: protein involved in polysaccharide export with SLBB domain [Ulvibacter sp.]|jgi:protein involved in polysaccharide export with SLBB domain